MKKLLIPIFLFFSFFSLAQEHLFFSLNYIAGPIREGARASFGMPFSENMDFQIGYEYGFFSDRGFVDNYSGWSIQVDGKPRLANKWRLLLSVELGWLKFKDNRSGWLTTIPKAGLSFRPSSRIGFNLRVQPFYGDFPVKQNEWPGVNYKTFAGEVGFYYQLFRGSLMEGY